MRRAGSPVQPSSLPRIAKSTPARLRTDAMERATLWLLFSSAAVQPTQKSTSAVGCWAKVGTSRPSAQSGAGVCRASPWVAALLPCS